MLAKAPRHWQFSVDNWERANRVCCQGALRALIEYPDNVAQGQVNIVAKVKNKWEERNGFCVILVEQALAFTTISFVGKLILFPLGFSGDFLY